MKVRRESILQCTSLARGLGLAAALAAAWTHGPPARSQGPAPGVPAAAQAEAEAAASPASVVEGYAAPAGDPDQVAALLQKRLAGRGRVFADPRSRKIVAVATPEVQREVTAWLAQYAAAMSRAGNPAAGIADPMPLNQPAQRSSQRLALKHLAWRDFEERLFRIWGGRLSAATNDAGDLARFQIQGASGQTTLEVDRRNGQINISAPGNTAGSWLKVLQAIDAAAPQPGQDARVVPLDKADPAMVLRAVSLIRAAMGENPLGPRRNQKTHIGQFVSMVFQPDGAQPPAAANEGQPAAQPDGAQPPGVQPGEGQPAEGQIPAGQAEAVAGVIDNLRLRGNVTIEIVGDVLVVRGPREDVERVLKIIEEIERQSIETRPEVELYQLKNVDATALSEVLTAIMPTALSYQGTVTVQPLKRPNALILIGRKENIPALVELIQKLDRPTAPDTQIQVIQLKNMSAIDAERFVRSFFVEQPGGQGGQAQALRTNLGTRVMTIADFRSNSLIVQASPRDLAEVTALLTKLDTTDGARNEIRVFKLRNSLAEQLAPALQEAITGVGGAAGAQQQQPQQPQGGGGQGGAGAQTPATMTRRATSLQFLRVDEQSKQVIESGVLSDMRIAADTRGNALIVVGPPSAMDLIAALIQQLDALPSAEAQIKVFTVTNGDATTLVEMLQNLFGQTAQGGGQGQQALQSATGSGESTLVPLRFSVDQRTNSIIVTGNPGDLDVVYQILARLDVPDLSQRVMRVFRLSSAPAVDVAATINSLLEQERELTQNVPELITPYQQVEREVLIVPEEVTNILIVSATPRYLEKIEAIIKELDKRPPMVAIQVVIAEVTLSDNEQFGIEWGLQDSLMFDRSIVSNRFGFNNSTFPNDNTAASLATRANVATQALSNLAVGRTDPTLGFGGLVLTASNESVNVLLRALEQSSRAQIISRPQVQTLDNTLAFVNVGALVPRITGTSQSTTGAVNPTLEDISVGIILEVTPRTSPDGTIVMQINATKSSVGPEATGIPIFSQANADGTSTVIRSPQIPLTTAQTIVSARTGQTVILGGLITKTLSETTRRIPYVADIPVLGRLFRFDSVSDTRTELLIIMTPYIIQNEEQSEWLNARESERMSWCIADIVNIHGPVNLSGNPAYNMQPSDVIFPDLDPTAPGPTPATLPGTMPPGTMPPGPTPAAPLPPLPGLPGTQQPIDPLVPPPLGSYGLSLPPPVQTAPVGTGATPPGATAGPSAVGSARRGAAESPLNELRSPNIQPVAPPPGTQAQLAPASFIAPAYYQR